MRYTYGMRLRPFGPGCQPKEGFLEWKDGTGRYWSFVTYNRPLTENETFVYSMDLIELKEEEKENV